MPHGITPDIPLKHQDYTGTQFDHQGLPAYGKDDSAFKGASVKDKKFKYSPYFDDNKFRANGRAIEYLLPQLKDGIVARKDLSVHKGADFKRENEIPYVRVKKIMDHVYYDIIVEDRLLEGLENEGLLGDITDEIKIGIIKREKLELELLAQLKGQKPLSKEGVEGISKFKNEVDALRVDKAKLEQDLKTEIASFTTAIKGAVFFKKKYKAEVEQLAINLKTTQESLDDANNKANNEKTQLLAELKAINVKIGTGGTIPEEINQQIDAIKKRLETILDIEGRDVLTVKEQQQAQHLQALKDSKLILSEEEKKANGDQQKTKKSRDKLEKHLNEKKDKITNKSVLFSVNIAFLHYKEEEQHHEDNHKYLKDLTDLNDKYN
ncbi:11043_t:CDS:2, partial [Cetraspora pellucida]